MISSRLFIGYQRKIEIPPIDRKRHLIENQKVFTRKNQRKKEIEYRPLSHTTFLKSMNTKKGLLLLLGSCIVVFLFLAPLFINIKSYFWEKQRVLYREDDVIYNLFLMEGMGKKVEETVEDESRSIILPSLKVVTYKVKKGDSLFGIARKFNVSVDAIITANTLKNAYYLPIGKQLKIPNMSGIFYTVAEGDNLSTISKRYGVGVNKIADINDLSSSIIRARQKIFIPGGTLSAWERASAIGEVFKSPVRGRLTSKMGFRIDPFTKRRAYHSGIDIANKIGTPIYASQYGRVVFAGYRGNFGKTVIIVHPQGYSTLYGHLDRITVKRGQAVSQGERIGTLGNTGRSTGSHLHFEVHQNGKLVDPLKVIRMR